MNGITARSNPEWAKIYEEDDKEREEIELINAPAGYGYDLTHVIRESLIWKLNLPLTKAQEVAEYIAEQVVYANWISIQGKELHKQFAAGYIKEGKKA